MKIQAASGLSPEEIQQRIKEAKEYVEKDKESVKFNKTKLQLKEELDTVKFFYDRHTAKLQPKEKSEIKNIIKRAENALDEDVIDALQDILFRVQTLRNKINNFLISEFED